LILIWGIVTLPVSKQEVLRYKTGNFFYLDMENSKKTNSSKLDKNSMPYKMGKISEF
jgi:hypothetical protein